MPSLATWLSFVRFSHTVFALPFAGISLLVAAARPTQDDPSGGGWPSLLLLVQVVLAMVAARTAAMAYNRFADRQIDAQNPRTAGREIPAGAVAASQALALVVLASAAFVAVAFWINTICGLLALPVLAVLLGYSQAKRFTSLAHVWLGFALGLSPLGAWVAVTGSLDESLAVPALLTAGITVWVAGFDVLYACQDEAFDRSHGLRSMVVAFGRSGAERAAAGLHAAAFVPFWIFGRAAGMGTVWVVALAICAGLLVVVHAAKRNAGALDAVAQRFFLANAGVPIALFTAALVERLFEPLV